MARRRNRRVVAYNEEAKSVMKEGQEVEIVDLHSAVVDQCGEPPYETCSIMRQPKDVHFNYKGNKLLGLKVAATLRSLLSKAKPRGNTSPPKAPELSAREGLASSYMHDDKSFCPDMVTRCLAGTTCSENLLSLTGYGCCMEPDAFGCPDSWHCCPKGSYCSADCNFRSCKCIFPSSRYVVSKVRNEANKTEENESKGEFKYIHGSNSEDVKAVRVDKPLQPIKNGKQGNDKKLALKTVDNKKVESKKENERKHTHKTAAKKKTEDITVKKMRGSKKKHYHVLGNKHRHHKKHEKRRGKKGRMSKTKMRSQAKGKTSRKILPSKHEVKVHRNHHKSNYHLTVKQHWVTRFGSELGATKKRKPKFAFFHVWGKRKHHGLSYKHNEKKKKGKYTSHTSLTDELKHLIVKHRRRKLKSGLRVRIHGSHEHDSKDNLERNKKKEKSTHSTKSGKFARFHNLKKLPSKAVEELKTSSKLPLEGENVATTNEFNNLKEALWNKEKVNEKISFGIHEHNPPKSQENTVMNHTKTWPKDSNATSISSKNQTYKLSRTLNNDTFKNRSTTKIGNQELNLVKSQENTDATTWSKNINTTIISFERPAGKIKGRSNDRGLKNESTTRSTKVKHRPILHKMSANIDEKEKANIDNSTNLSEETSSPGSELHQHIMSSAVHSKAVNKTKSVSPAIESRTAYLKPSRLVHFESNKTDANQTNISRPSGKGDTLNSQVMINSGAKILDASTAVTNDVFSTSGLSSRIGEIVSGSGLKVSGSFSGFMGEEWFPQTGRTIKGEDAAEQMNNYDSKFDGGVSSSGFQTATSVRSMASGFLEFSESTPVDKNNRNLHTDNDYTKEVKDISGATKVDSGDGKVLVVPKALTGDRHKLNDTTVKNMGKMKDRVAGEGGLESTGEYSFISGSSFDSLSSASNGYNDRAVVRHKIEHLRANLGLTGSGFDIQESSGVSKGYPSNNDSGRAQLIKNLLLENNENENLSSKIEDSSTGREGYVLEGDGLYMSSSRRPDAISVSTVDGSVSGSEMDDSSRDFESGGERDVSEESNVNVLYEWLR